MRTWPLAMAFLLALAGCADKAPPAEPEDDGPDVGATETTGGIRGVVYDGMVAPVAGVRIAIQSIGQEQTTDAAGQFVFSDLQPGTYVLVASKAGYATVQQNAAVVAGDERPPMVKIQVLVDAVNAPSAQTIPFEGFLQCGAGVTMVGSLNACAVAESVNTFEVDVSGNHPDFVQVELVWEGTNALGDGLSLGIFNASDELLTDFASVDGPSPLVLRVPASEFRAALGPDHTEYIIRVFPGTNAPLSVVLEQRFSIFATNFYNTEPAEDWRFIEDGDYVLA